MTALKRVRPSSTRAHTCAGLIGPGAGAFYMLGFVMLAGHGVLRATAHTKLLNFASNIGAFIYFAISGAVVWKLGLAMGVGQFFGAQAGSRLAMAKGARVIRPLLVITCIGMTLKLLSDPANPLRVWIPVDGPADQALIARLIEAPATP